MDEWFLDTNLLYYLPENVNMETKNFDILKLRTFVAGKKKSLSVLSIFEILNNSNIDDLQKISIFEYIKKNIEVKLDANLQKVLLDRVLNGDVSAFKEAKTLLYNHLLQTYIDQISFVVIIYFLLDIYSLSNISKCLIAKIYFEKKVDLSIKDIKKHLHKIIYNELNELFKNNCFTEKNIKSKLFELIFNVREITSKYFFSTVYKHSKDNNLSFRLSKQLKKFLIDLKNIILKKAPNNIVPNDLNLFSDMIKKIKETGIRLTNDEEKIIELKTKETIMQRVHFYKENGALFNKYIKRLIEHIFINNGKFSTNNILDFEIVDYYMSTILINENFNIGFLTFDEELKKFCNESSSDEKYFQNDIPEWKTTILIESLKEAEINCR